MAIQMESIMNNNIMNRIKKLDKSSAEVNNHFVFKESLNFNFLYHLFSQTLEHLFNNIEKISDKDFNKKMEMLNETVSRLQTYVIE
ncbi:MAG: hypothetical protein ACTSPA_00650 [Promethearchaeota archaeon]